MEDTNCPGFEVLDGSDGPWVSACTRMGCSCKKAKPPTISARCVEPGFTAAMLAEAEKADEVF